MMTVSELARYFGVSKRQVYDLLNSESGNGFPAFKVGHSWRVNLDELREWMCRREEERDLQRLSDGAKIK